MKQPPNAARVLIVDDDDAVRLHMSGIVDAAGYSSHEVETAEAAMEFVLASALDVVLMDIRLPGRSGLEALSDIARVHPDLPVILITGHASLDGAVEAMRSQAFDYLIKPVSPTDLRSALRRAMRHVQLDYHSEDLRNLVENDASTSGVIARSESMRSVLSLVSKLHDNQSPVLIRGESGTGKDVIARMIHLEGSRVNEPFVAINCAALPEGLLESELFGYAKGAFTGADGAKAGLFAQAHGGTIFLDEICEMAPALQSKLLRVLQDRRVRPLGSTEDFFCDVRIIAATNQDLASSLRTGSLRRDLYYRLNVIPIALQPLRERREDIAPLAMLFVSRIDSDRSLSPSALALLQRYDWPGNVRELANVIERSLVLCDSTVLDEMDIHIDRLSEYSDPLALSPSEETRDNLDANEFCQRAATAALTLKELQKKYIEEVLRLTAGNKTAAARILGLNRTTLYRRSP